MLAHLDYYTYPTINAFEEMHYPRVACILTFIMLSISFNQCTLRVNTSRRKLSSTHRAFVALGKHVHRSTTHHNIILPPLLQYQA
eukprot:c24581_g4_i1 orf=11-265(-)